MQIVLVSLTLLLVVALSGVVLRLLPVKLPLPLVQIALGAMLAMPPLSLHVRFDHEVFFLLFIPPLLFADGWRIPKREFFLLRTPILTLALGLVFGTVAGLGYFVHWMIPTVPLAVAFALASVLSPTDAVAVSSITGGASLPSRLLHLLEGEALMNDASGLVSLQFSVAAALTGAFSLRDASIKFVLVAVGGLAVGFATTWLFSRVRRRLVRWSGDIDPPSQVALLLLLPFAAYLLAEDLLHVSGILAAVAAGMTIKYTDILKGGQAALRIQNNTVWNMLQFVFNGIIFLLLGLQLPEIVGQAPEVLNEAGGGSLWMLLGYVLAISVLLVLMRFVWIWCSLRVARLIARLRGRKTEPASTRMIWVTALAGVRGAISLAGVLSLPVVMMDGSPFPTRGLMIFLATGVILCTLLIGSIGLPKLLKNIELPEDPHAREEHFGRSRASAAAIKAVERWLAERPQSQGELYDAVASRVGSRVVSDYQQRIAAMAEEDDDASDVGEARLEVALERELRMTALRAEREEVARLNRAHMINDTTLRMLAREIDTDEAAVDSLQAKGGH
ncbi:Na+/H+ antiporter [Frateuria aurantia]|uniref:Na+ antiporter n=1 Tax=Frateuria aurantia (strain ATCC 33424 / DSM 6220 / KCTC 2777 / LMG 1558 / NBRC 3245 / NCIMB 13370) TaxID=767434 RepID=H8KZL6_FRAAD|nr:Na+/H+ antiporter [Frateuria aurantia]AFC87076.1 Na+ antiporter [Frateuria aurantia DSM 6220]